MWKEKKRERKQPPLRYVPLKDDKLRNGLRGKLGWFGEKQKPLVAAILKERQ